MTIHAWPLDGKQFSAADMRLWLASLLEQDGVDNTLGPVRVRGGVRRSQFPVGGNGQPLWVQAQATPNMTVKVNPGTAWIPASSGLGTYELTSDAVTNVTIAPSHASLNRVDLIVAQIIDNGDNTSTYGLSSIAGTAATTPSPPATPSNSLALAQVAVGAGVTSITTGNITDVRVYAAALGGSSYSASPAIGVQSVDTSGVFSTLTQNTWTSTFTGGPTISASFVAPASGQIEISCSGVVYNQFNHQAWGNNNFYTYLNALVTGPSGYSRSPVDTESAIGAGGGVNPTYWAQSCSSFLVSGLTPAATYTATLQGRTSDGTGVYFTRKLVVKPVAT